MNHQFTQKIYEILSGAFGQDSQDVFEKSQLLQYINLKTRSASRGAKARGSFANLYAIYVTIEDYLAKGFFDKNGYEEYEGAEFIKLFRRQRELPFGSKLQNHALNNRMNSEFQKFFPRSECIPILRNFETNRYWFNENLIRVLVGKKVFNIAKVVIQVIDEYAKTKKDAFERFIQTCLELQQIETKQPKEQAQGEFT